MSESVDIQFKLKDVLTLRGVKFSENSSNNEKLIPVLCLAGLSRSDRDFHEIGKFLSKQGYVVYAINMRGRGSSDYDIEAKYNLMQECSDVIECITQLNLNKINLIGTSRGGILGMMLAAYQPDLISNLILNDIGSEVSLNGIRQIFNRLSSTTTPQSWSDAIKFIKNNMQAEFTAFSEDDFERFAYLTYKNVDGKPVQDFDSNILNDFINSISELPEDQNYLDITPIFQSTIHINTLLIHGENSSILDQNIVEKMQASHPKLTTLEIKGQGHAVDLQGDIINQAILNHLQK